VGRPDFDNKPSLGQYFLHIRNASAGSRILSIGKTGIATGPSFDEKGRPFRQPTDIRGRKRDAPLPGQSLAKQTDSDWFFIIRWHKLLLQSGGAPLASAFKDGAVYQGGEFHGLTSADVD
jgi:hypothetical protein